MPGRGEFFQYSGLMLLDDHHFSIKREENKGAAALYGREALRRFSRERII